MKKFNILLSFCLLTFSYSLYAEKNIIKLLSTTSTRDSGLLDYLLPNFENKYNIQVHTLAFGTGYVLGLAKNCDGDLLLTHAESLELKFIDDGFGLARSDLMYNDFVIIGPSYDPANVSKSTSAIEAFERIFISKHKFVSRGDNSGTNLSERNLWSNLELKNISFTNDWYLETGQGMGATLNVAIGMEAYTYTDRATWLRFANKYNHVVLFEGDPMLFNQYGITLINPEHCVNINHKSANLLYNWLLSKPTQKLISDFKVNGHYLFYPNYDK